jgi:hypothetical protein
MGTCYNSITVRAPIAQVWEQLHNFHDMTWAKGVVETVEVVGEQSGDQVGARRIINGAFHETLVELSSAEHQLRYTIDDGPGPVAKGAVQNYVGTVRALPITADDSTFIEWSSSYESAEAGAVGELCDPIYRALLGALQNHFN